MLRAGPSRRHTGAGHPAGVADQARMGHMSHRAIAKRHRAMAERGRDVNGPNAPTAEYRGGAAGNNDKDGAGPASNTPASSPKQ